MSTTTMKTTRESLDRLRPYAKFGDSWNTVLNKVLDKMDKINDSVDEVNNRVDDLEDDLDSEEVEVDD
jgi:hypothetical protein